MADFYCGFNYLQSSKVATQLTGVQITLLGLAKLIVMLMTHYGEFMLEVTMTGLM